MSRLRGKGIAGGLVALVGAVLIVFGLYQVVLSDFVAANIPTIVGAGLAYVLYGAVILIVGVVVVNFRNAIALALHLGAVVPYYFAIQRIIEVGQTGSATVNAYWSASSIAWIVGIALNFLGILANRVVATRRKEEARAPAEAPAPPDAPPSR